MLSLVCSLCAAPTAILATLKSDGKVLSICLECFRPELHEILPPPKMYVAQLPDAPIDAMLSINESTRRKLLLGDWPDKEG